MTHAGAKVLGFFCLALLVGAIAAGPAAAIAPEESATTQAGQAAAPKGVLVVPGTAEPLVLTECPLSDVCFWSGKTFGRAEAGPGLNSFSYFHGYETGRHELENINPQSMYNRTYEHNVSYETGKLLTPYGTVRPQDTYQWGTQYYGGIWIE